jgi:putative Mg2+ transporter-C (MgtC) family protein
VAVQFCRSVLPFSIAVQYCRSNWSFSFVVQFGRSGGHFLEIDRQAVLFRVEIATGDGLANAASGIDLNPRRPCADFPGVDLGLIAQQFQQLDWTAFLLAIAVGGAIGLERELHGRPAGVRTHIMVCLSAAIAIRASQSVPTALGESVVGHLVFDPNRLAAGIVTGIGFLGAATVIRSGDIVRGITTGACVWAVAVLGIVIGQQHYALALAGTAAMLAVLIGFDWAFRWVNPVVYRRLVVLGSGTDLTAISAALREVLQGKKIRIQDIAGRIDPIAQSCEIDAYIRCRNLRQAPELLTKIGALEGVSHVEWVQIGD